MQHEERHEIPGSTAEALDTVLRTRERPLMAVGTPSLRTLEAAWDGASLARAGATRLFIRPGYRLTTADHLLTNFHLPESTLFVLVPWRPLRRGESPAPTNPVDGAEGLK